MLRGNARTGYVPGVDTPRKHAGRYALALVLIVAWIGVLLFGWALRPIEDTVPVVVDPSGELAEQTEAERFDVVSRSPDLQLVDCNTLFAGSARDASEPLPRLTDGLTYSRTPCNVAHSDARWAFGLNVIFVVVMLVGWVLLFVRSEESDDRPAGRPVQAMGSPSGV